MDSIINNGRAAMRLAVGIPAIVFILFPLVAVQGVIVGPLFNNYNAIPQLIYKMVCPFLGYKLRFNTAAAKDLDKNKQIWFVANHLSMCDFIVLGAKLKGTFAGKEDILKWPFIRMMAFASKMVGIVRNKEGTPLSRGRIINNFNEDRNLFLFPEGTFNNEITVGQFNKGLFGPLFGEKGVNEEGKEVSLKKQDNIVVVPVAVSVAEVNGVSTKGRPELWDAYMMYTQPNVVKRIWKRLQMKSVIVDITLRKALVPAEAGDAQNLMNQAALAVAEIVNPGQTKFEKKKIPAKVASA